MMHLVIAVIDGEVTEILGFDTTKGAVDYDE